MLVRFELTIQELTELDLRTSDLRKLLHKALTRATADTSVEGVLLLDVTLDDIELNVI